MIVTVPQLKQHLNLTGTCDDDTLLRIKIDAAEGVVRSYTGRTWGEFYDSAEDVYSVPPELEEAVLQIAASLYENREGGTFAPSVYALMDNWKLWSF